MPQRLAAGSPECKRRRVLRDAHRQHVQRDATKILIFRYAWLPQAAKRLQSFNRRQSATL